ncbi:MAG: DUF362 domain-containing protein [Gemmatimonadota bacterium]
MDRSSRAKVAISHTSEKHRSPARVLGLVREAINHLGGMENFVQPGHTVLIKPDLSVFYSAEEGCTTDPLVVGALIHLAKAAGAVRVLVAESTAESFSTLEVMEVTGMASVAEREGAELLDLAGQGIATRTVAVPNGQVLGLVPLPVALLDADVIIDVPKAKNHHIEPISGALKNWMGIADHRYRAHSNGDEQSVQRFMDIMTVTRPTLCVVDALIAGEGDGPIANVPRWCGCIIASTDPVATDVTIARLMGRDWRKLQLAREAERRGLGVRESIDYAGVPLDSVSFKAWPSHEGLDYLPINLLVGQSATLAGSLGHVKRVLDSLLRRGELQQIMGLRGTPTIMIGDAEDPAFEEHLKEGPYLVFDDTAKPEYKDDPRVHFTPGHPVPQDIMPQLMRGLGVGQVGRASVRWQELTRWGMHEMKNGSATRKVQTVAAPLFAVGMAVAGAAALATLVRGGVRRRRGRRATDR